MTTRIITPQNTIILLVIVSFLILWGYGNSDKEITAIEAAGVVDGNSLVTPVPRFEALPQPANEGVYISSDKTEISVSFAQMPRLMIIQRMAEVGSFSFSLPDDAIDYWQESLTVNITNKSIQDALIQVIGIKNFNLEHVYDPSTARHRISAVFLGSSHAGQTLSSPVGGYEPIPFERDFAEAPKPELSIGNESRAKRDNFFTSDEQSRVALLNEMSPVGDDLRYIVTSLSQDEKVSVRIAAAQRLSFSESYAATQSLIDALSDKDEVVVTAAINSLVTLGDLSVLPVIENKLVSKKHLLPVVEEAKNRMDARQVMGSDRPD